MLADPEQHRQQGRLILPLDGGREGVETLGNPDSMAAYTSGGACLYTARHGQNRPNQEKNLRLNHDCVGYARYGDLITLIVADGVGSQGKAGGAAARLMVDILASKFNQGESISSKLFEDCQRELTNRFRQDYPQFNIDEGQTCLAVAQIDPSDRTVTWFRVGDCRIHIFDPLQEIPLILRSRDQGPTEDYVDRNYGRVRRDQEAVYIYNSKRAFNRVLQADNEAASHHLRNRISHAVSAYTAGSNLVRTNYYDYPTINEYTYSQGIEPYIVVTTDGVHDYGSVEQLASLVRRYYNNPRDFLPGVDEYTRGANDNIGFASYWVRDTGGAVERADLGRAKFREGTVQPPRRRDEVRRSTFREIDRNPKPDRRDFLVSLVTAGVAVGVGVTAWSLLGSDTPTDRAQNKISENINLKKSRGSILNSLGLANGEYLVTVEKREDDIFVTLGVNTTVQNRSDSLTPGQPLVEYKVKGTAEAGYSLVEGKKLGKQMKGVPPKEGSILTLLGSEAERSIADKIKSLSQ